jgi:hypothetical protein
MKTIPVMVLIHCFALVAHARIGVQTMSYQNRFDQADLVAIAQPISTKETSEYTVLPDIAPTIDVVGLETEFRVQILLKGANSITDFVLHHYRQCDPSLRFGSGPWLVSFDPAKKETYLLFLKKEPDGRFASINGQTDPGYCGVLPADQIDLVAIVKPLSEKRYVDTKTWSELYHGKADCSPPQYLAGYETEFVVKSMLKGENGTKRFVFRHYESLPPSTWDNSRPYPLSIDFQPKPEDLYLLLLKKEKENYFTPMRRTGVYGEELSRDGFPVVRLDKESQKADTKQ